MWGRTEDAGQPAQGRKDGRGRPGPGWSRVGEDSRSMAGTGEQGGQERNRTQKQRNNIQKTKKKKHTPSTITTTTGACSLSSSTSWSKEPREAGQLYIPRAGV